MYENYTAYDPNPGVTGDTVMGAYAWVVAIAYLLYFMFMQYKMAHRTGQADIAWWAFIPILNTLLLIQMAGKALRFFWLLLIPFVNVIGFFILWINAARNCGQSGFWGFLVMFPLLNIIPLFVLAMSSPPYVYPDFMDETGPGPHQRPRSPQQVG
jgi:magnesium-transporting ATPase (P-type)